MANGLVIHIVSGEDKHTEVATQDRILIGPGEGCDLRLRASDLPARQSESASVLELARANGHYRVKDFDHSLDIKHNGEPLTLNHKIEDGDEVRFGTSELMLQFFPIRSLPAIIEATHRETHVAPFIEQAAIEAANTPRRDDAKVFLREFTRELVREINLTTKLISLAIVLVLVGGVLYIGYSLVKALQASQHLIAEQRKQIEQMKEQVDKTNGKISDLSESNKAIQNSLSLAVKLRSEYGRGVCLIAGSFIFVENGTGRPLRYPETQATEDGTVLQNGNETPQLTPEGKGAVAEFEFVGTGFYVGDGFVITNKHIAQPWVADERAQGLGSSVSGKPRLKKLVAYFPNYPQPLLLKFQQAAARDDLAVCTLDVKELPTDIPVLPLETNTDAVATGQTVVMMGYPSGPDRLLALLDDTEARSIQARYGSSLETLLGYLSDSKRIQPLTTQGHITDLDARRIVYDARTAEGGSGAPLFGPSGKVIGINFAVFIENSASNLAVPVRFASGLLERAGWKSPEQPEGEQSQNSNLSQTNARGNTAANTSR
ncbi:MAG TPA: trypsin-like peptidase domain-containing protein [Pyrinomonadaceae bacterium]|jgi:S1-C subfamily serine protease